MGKEETDIGERLLTIFNKKRKEDSDAWRKKQLHFGRSGQTKEMEENKWNKGAIEHVLESPARIYTVRRLDPAALKREEPYFKEGKDEGDEEEENEEFRRCKGTTVRGLRCLITSRSVHDGSLDNYARPAHHSLTGVEFGSKVKSHYCEFHKQQETEGTEEGSREVCETRNWRFIQARSVFVPTLNSLDSSSSLSSSSLSSFFSPPSPLSHGFQFKSAYAGVNEREGEQKYEQECLTNLTKNFQGCLDYIFFSSRFLSVTSTKPLMSAGQAEELGWLPCSEFPSDHLLLAATFQFLH